MKLNKSERTLGPVFLASEHLGWGITGRTTKGLHEPVSIILPPKAKVGELDVAVLVEEDVLELEVSVHDPHAVAVPECDKELSYDASGLQLAERAILDEVVKQLSARTELRDKVDGRLGRKDLKELANVWMMQATVVVDLTRKQRRRRSARDLLNSDSRVGQPVKAQAHAGKTACHSFACQFSAWTTKRVRAHRYDTERTFTNDSPKGIVAHTLERRAEELFAKFAVGVVEGQITCKSGIDLSEAASSAAGALAGACPMASSPGAHVCSSLPIGGSCW